MKKRPVEQAKQARLDMITEQTLADETETPIRTWQTLRVRGDGPPFYKLGWAVRYSRREVAEWLATRRRHSTSEASP